VFEQGEFNQLRRSETSLGNIGYSRGFFWFVFLAGEKNERMKMIEYFKPSMDYLD